MHSLLFEAVNNRQHSVLSTDKTSGWSTAPHLVCHDEPEAVVLVRRPDASQTSNLAVWMPFFLLLAAQIGDWRKTLSYYPYETVS
jgi:hypothetical protein